MNKHPRAVRVLLGKVCPPEIQSNNRLLVVRYLPSDRYFLNERSLSEAQLRQTVRDAVEHRFEKIVWIAADERLSYGSVVAITAKLQSDTPALHIAIATKSQIGPVDPVQIERMRGRRNDGMFIGAMPCVFSSAIE